MRSFLRRFALALATVLLLSGCGTRSTRAPLPPAPDQHLSSVPQVSAPYDLVIRGGRVLDGTGTPAVRADVGIRGDRIAAVGDLSNAQAAQELDATGLIVAPGFINPHSHTHDSINPYEDLDATASLMQGITTEIGGVDGRSPLPLKPEFDRLTRNGTGVNFGLFAGQGSVRKQVMGDGQGPAGAAELAAMKALARQAMEEGAFGLSTGLEYVPGRYAAASEVTALVAETKAYGGIYSTHMRSEGDRIEEALDEALKIATDAGVPVNLSHFKIVKFSNWSKEEAVVRKVEEARAAGMKVFADVYPYLAPDYAINRPLSEWAGSPPDQIVVTKAADPALAGKNLAQIALARGWSPQETAGKLIALDPRITIVAQVSSEPAMTSFLQADWGVVSTDGESQPKLSDPAAALQFHPRSYGSYPRLLGLYVRQRRIMPLELMIRKMTGAVADGLGLRERGYVKPGKYADLVVFDPESVADRTSWLAPQEYPAGIRHVVVNGSLAVEEGRRLPGRPGRIVRRGE